MSKLLENITDDELRYLSTRLQQAKLAKFLGLKPGEMSQLKKEKKLQTPIEYLKSLSKDSLSQLFYKFDSLVDMAKYYSVSVAFLKSLKVVAADSGLHGQSVFNQVSLKEELARVGNIELVSMLYGVKVSEIRVLMKKQGINNQDIVALHKNKFESSKGREGELQFAQFRGKSILEDTNHTNPHANWDYVDTQLGKVNVKSSKEYTTKKGERYYKFSLGSIQHSDNVAFMCYDRDFKVFLSWFVVKSNDLLPLNKKSVSVYAAAFKHIAYPTAGIPMMEAKYVSKTTDNE